MTCQSNQELKNYVLFNTEIKKILCVASKFKVGKWCINCIIASFLFLRISECKWYVSLFQLIDWSPPPPPVNTKMTRFFSSSVHLWMMQFCVGRWQMVTPFCHISPDISDIQKYLLRVAQKYLSISVVVLGQGQPPPTTTLIGNNINISLALDSEEFTSLST